MNRHFCGKRIAHLLGCAALAPAALLALGSWLAPGAYVGDFVNGQRAWAMATLPVLGGVHWGAALAAADLNSSRTKRAMLWGVCPSLFAWSSILAGGFAFAVLMAGFIVCYQVDKRLYPWYPLPPWLLHLRLIITIGMVALMMATVMAGNVRI
jgi:hypothetical protein